MSTHNTWDKVFGKVQKCDCCEQRAKTGVTYQCHWCKKQVCESCARSGKLQQTDGVIHVLDTETVSSSPRQDPQTPGTLSGYPGDIIAKPISLADSPEETDSSNAGPASASTSFSDGVWQQPSRSRMAEILRLYSEIYPNSDKTEPPEMFQITSIPTAVSFSDGPALGASAGRIREYEAYHERVVKTQFGSQVRGSLPPPPPGYVEWSFRKYPVQGRDQAPGYNIPTRTTPQYNPLNEFNSEELLALHSDRDLQKEMERAWARIRNEELSQERSSKRSEETRRAFQLLWEVFLLRRYWTGPLKADQTTRWFVQERNRLRV